MAQSSTFASAGQIFHASIGSVSNEERVIERIISNHKTFPPNELDGKDERKDGKDAKEEKKAV